MAWMPKSTPKTEHKYVDQRLSAYIDGELPPEEQGVVERHLASCQDCQWNLDTLRQTVQWTRELPTVPVPRVFTVPIAARPERARRWRWSLPLLQGATALVALLLVFMVAGDFLLAGRLAVVAPSMGGAVMEQPAADVQLTAAVVAEAEAELETPAIEEPQAEDKALLPPSAAPTTTVQKALPAEKAIEEAQVAVTPTSENATMGAVSFEPPAEGEKEAAGAPRAPAPPGTVTETLDVTAAKPTTTSSPTVAPTLATTAAPTVVALAPEAAEAPAERKEAVTAWQPQPLTHWLSAAEIILAVVFVLLASATVVLMVRRRRAR